MSFKNLYLRYGTHQHAVGECSVAISGKTTRSGDGLPLSTSWRWEVVGRLQAETQADLTAAIEALKKAYATDGKDVGLYFDDGTPTAHLCRSKDTLYGVIVASPPQYPSGVRAEYSTFRNYSLALEWEIGAKEATANGSGGGGASAYKTFQETIQYRGTGGPDWKFVDPIEGPPIMQQLCERTFVTLTQSGSATALGVVPPFPEPLFPAYEHGPSRVTSLVGPSIGARERQIQWSYTFLLPAMVGATPHSR